MRSLNHRQLIILIGLTLVRGLLYLSLFPPWLAPDEPAHFEVVRILGQADRSPTRNYYDTEARDPALLESFQAFRFWELAQRPTPTQWLNSHNLAETPLANYPYIGRFIYAETYPILPHVVLSPLLSTTNSLDIATRLYLLRLVSVMFLVAIVIISWWITRQIFPEQRQFWLAIPAFIIFLPMHTHIFAAVNTDVFAGLLGAILLSVLIAIFNKGATPLKLFSVLLLAILVLFIKRSVIFVILWAAMAIMIYVGYRQKWSVKHIVQAIILALFIFVAMMWVIVYTGVFPITGVGMFDIKLVKALPINQLIDSGLPPAAIAKIYAQLGVFFFITFWGAFGWAGINIPWPLAWAMMVGCAIVVAGAGWYLIRVFKGAEVTSSVQRAIFIVLLVGIILAVAGTFVPILVTSITWSPAARYVYPVIIPIATFFFLGVRQLCPLRYRQTVLLPLWIGALVLFDTYTVTRVIIPYLYG